MPENDDVKLIDRAHSHSKFAIGCGIITIGFVLTAMFTYMAIVATESPGVAVAFFRFGSSLAIFAIGSFLVYRLWSLVLEALGGGSSVYARGLLRLLGNISVDIQSSEGIRGRVAGAGLLGTLIIVIVAVIAIYFVLGAEIGKY